MIAVGPFKELLTLRRLKEGGAVSDQELEIVPQAGILVEEGRIMAIAPFSQVAAQATRVEELPTPCVALPAFIDAHTHLCFAGSRAGDYALRLQGVDYQTIAARGGGIMDTVRHTREASREALIQGVVRRARQLFSGGVGTAEVKSGYGLSVDQEIKMLEAIDAASSLTPMAFVPCCLAAHLKPPEWESAEAYLTEIVEKLLPQVKSRKLANRVDIFVEEKAFSRAEAKSYLLKAKAMGFDLTVHADQFTVGGARLAAQVGAISADHLEVSGEQELLALREGGVAPVMLPGATLGLGLPFPPARTALDLGLPLCLASDWNPGSAPMGCLLTQAALLSAAQKLTMAETFAAITVRAAKALNLKDRGLLDTGLRADLVIFPTHDYREILYHQGALRPSHMIIEGRLFSL